MIKRTILISALSAAACGTPDLTSEDLGVVEQAINGGAAVTSAQNDDDPFRAVIGFTPHPLELPDCTATKISQGSTDKYVTAAHCLPGVVANTPIRYTSALDDFEGNFIETRIRTVFQHPSCLTDPSGNGNCISASVNSYDVAVFTIDQDTSVSVLDASPAINTAETAANTSVRMIGYGCDEASDNDSEKQTAVLTTRAQGTGVSAAMHARYINTTGFPQGCAGDSGGPLLQNVVTPKLLGVTSFSLERDPATNNDDITAFTRLANVRRWISTPQKLNVIANGELGFLQNRGQRRCAELSGTNANTNECKGSKQPVDVQYWKLNAIAGTSFFQIQSSTTGQCLVAGSFNTVIGTTTCASASQFQHWSLTTATAPFLKIQARTPNAVGGGVRCLAANASNQLALDICDMTVTTRNWVFYP